MDDEKNGCCAPARGGSAAVAVSILDIRPGEDASAREAVRIPGGRVAVGVDEAAIPHDGESPRRTVRLKPFSMDATAVTNARFARFVEDTGYVTEAEQFGWSICFHSHIREGVETKGYHPQAPWWRQVDRANWRLINGPGSEEDWKPDHPVVQISWNDANAFAKWADGRLPTEAEWEHAARGGLDDPRFPWGNREPNDEDFFPCNIWQGVFPDNNTGADGYAASAPAKSFKPNGLGLYNMCGNVWDWTADAFRIRSLKKPARARQASMKGYKTVKGGSFLCHISYCYRYRIAARTGNSPDSATTHMGFRLAYDLD